MSNSLSQKTVGLFGTCDTSKWREPFLELFKKHGIAAFNPMVDNWTPDMAELEAWHLANDQLLLFPVTSESYGFGSLAESGFSINTALSLNKGRFVMIYIAPDVDEALKAEDPLRAKASRNARALAIAHLKHLDNPNVFVVSSMQEMLEKVLQLYAAIDLLESVRGATNTWRQSMRPMAWLSIVQGDSDSEQAEPANSVLAKALA